MAGGSTVSRGDGGAEAGGWIAIEGIDIGAGAGARTGLDARKDGDFGSSGGSV